MMIDEDKKGQEGNASLFNTTPTRSGNQKNHAPNLFFPA
jgi:hypothetical protein